MKFFELLFFPKPVLQFGTGFCFLCGVKNKSGLNNMSIMVVFKKIVYLCSKFMQVSFLCELTYCILADLSARLNLVNSTLEARISHSRFVAFSEGTDRFACFASRPTRAEPRKWQMGFRVLPFCKWTRRNCGNPLEEAQIRSCSRHELGKSLCCTELQSKKTESRMAFASKKV